MKKFTTLAISILLILGLVAGFCSCSKSSSKEDSTNTTTTTSATIATTETVETTTTTENVRKNLWEITNVGLVGPKDFFIKFEYPYHYEIVETNDQACLLLNHYTREVWLVDLKEGISFKCISGNQKVINYTVAGVYVYWFNSSKEVWAIDMYDESRKPYLFCKNAIGVSPFTDERQGAIVEKEKNNYTGNDSPFYLYTPYGNDQIIK